jgi:hypothetical protein
MTKPPILCCVVLILIGTLGQALAAGPTAAVKDEPAAYTGSIYFVAATGSDFNPGTEAQPWRTVQKAADTLVAGDTVYIRAGIYRERVMPQNSGSAGQYITYAAYPGETVTMDGSGITLPDDLAGLFHISNKSYIVVSGLRVIDAGPNDNNAGILVLDSSHIVVENNATYNTYSSGIGVWGSDHVTVDGNRVEEAGGGGWQECISVAGTDTFEVRYNEVLNCHKEGIDAKDGASNGQIYRNHVHHTQQVGIYVDAYDKHTYNIAVYQNIVHDIQDNNGFAIGSEQGGLLENIWVYNNIAYNNRYVGLTLHDCCPGPSTHPVQNITVVNNTFYHNGWTVWGGGISVDNPDIQNAVIRNNIVSQNLYFQIAVNPSVPAQNVAIDHNLIDGYRGTEGEIYGDNYVEGDPLFVDPSGANFHLQESSPAIDRGSAVDAPADDYDGHARPQDGDQDGVAGYDIGAYEVIAYSEHVRLPLILKNYRDTSSSWWKPPVGASWQVQYSGDSLDQSFAVDIYDVDMFDTDAATIVALHAQGRRVLCYVNVGAWEDWRPDAAQFPAAVLGDNYAGWPGERWLDIRRIDLLGPLIRARLDLGRTKGCDGIDPDNVNGYVNETGFPLTAQDQLAYNIWVANEAHARGLSIGLKNDEAQVNDLLPYFDWALTESCFAEGWCAEMQPFIDAGKPVFAIEYTDVLTGDQFLTQICPQAAAMHASAILKHRELDAWRQACP